MGRSELRGIWRDRRVSPLQLSPEQWPKAADDNFVSVRLQHRDPGPRLERFGAPGSPSIPGLAQRSSRNGAAVISADGVENIKPVEIPGAEMDSLMSTPNRPQDQQQPAPGGGTAHPDATVDYIPKNTMSPAGSVRGELHAQSGPYDFLDPPRASGELGWLAHYRVRRCIGEGGMGLVFEAEDTDLLRPVALKVIRPELAGSTQATQRFTLEARATAALKHDHIVTIYQVGQVRGVPFLAMEYLQGMSLHRWLERT